MNPQKKYVAFLSFADPDRELANSISNLLSELGQRAYFAPLDLPKTGTPEWRRAIISAIQNSCTFLPIYTRHSLRRPWVLYESGVADASKLPRFPARVSSVSVSDIDYLPSRDALCYDLSDIDSLADLLTNVCLQKGVTREEISPRVHRVLDSMENTIKKIITLSKIRWVFIAGNFARDASQPDSGIKWYTTQADYEARLKDFVETLTETLLCREFSISACPQVPAVGRHVTNKALSCLDSKHYLAPADFKIGGIYPIDREAREITLSEGAKRKWLGHLLSFRKTYLADQEWLIVIGGNVGTSEEYEAARECGVKVFPIPCFGGTAASIADPERNLLAEPCRSCQRRDGLCGSEGIAKVVEYLEKKCL